MDGLSGRAVVFAELPTSTTPTGCEGKLLLIVGEMDTNVPPESTMRLVDALIKAGKDFELLVVPNANHGMGGAYGQRRMNDFFVRHLQPGAPAPAAGRSDTIAARRGAFAASTGKPPECMHQPGEPRALALTWGSWPTTQRATGCDRALLSRPDQLPTVAADRGLAAARRADARVHAGMARSARQRADFDRLSQDGKVDYLLFKNYLSHQLRQLDLREGASLPVIEPGAVCEADSRARRVKTRIESDGLVEGRGSLTKLDQGDHRGKAGARARFGVVRSKVKKPVVNRHWHRPRICGRRCAAGMAFMTVTIRSSPGGWKIRTRRWTRAIDGYAEALCAKGWGRHDRPERRFGDGRRRRGSWKADRGGRPAAERRRRPRRPAAPSRSQRPHATPRSSGNPIGREALLIGASVRDDFVLARRADRAGRKGARLVRRAR